MRRVLTHFSQLQMAQVIPFLCSLLVVISLGNVAQGAEPEGPLARPPKFPPEVVAVFFPDIRAQLSGPRPDYGVGRGGNPSIAAAPSGAAANPSAATGFAWSSLADADAIEAEIKRQVAPLGPLVATPSKFKGGAYRECRDRFNTLAIMFAVSADYDDSIRWQDSAASLSRVFARASANCKVGTDQSYRESQGRVGDLAELVQGGRPSISTPSGESSWGDLADRTPLMVRMEQALNGAILPNLSSGRDLASHGDDLRHEAQMLALLSHVLTQPGLPDAADESYDRHAHRLRDGALALVGAIDQDNFTAAKAALGTMSQACAACHDEYR